MTQQEHPGLTVSHPINVWHCYRYAEAGAAASRIQELKAAQAQQLRAELTASQASELSQLQEKYKMVRKAMLGTQTRYSSQCTHVHCYLPGAAIPTSAADWNWPATTN